MEFALKYSTILFLDVTLFIITVLFFLFRVKKINYWIGYRTRNSIKNQENWNFSQKFFFDRWPLIIPLIIIIQIIFFSITSLSSRFIENFSVIIFLTYSIILVIVTERTIKKIK
jgi:uncharacterized membrane protein